jgi:fumarylpyruvate hydrolase
MGSDAKRTTSLFYETKQCGGAIGRDNPFPPATENLHHEVELVVVLKTGGTDIDRRRAVACLWLRRRQRPDPPRYSNSRKIGLPWDMAKGSTIPP